MEHPTLPLPRELSPTPPAGLPAAATPDGRLGRIPRLAARALRMPAAFLSVREDDGAFSLHGWGMDVPEVGDFISAGVQVVGRDGLIGIEDARADERFSAKHSVAGPPYLRAYGGAPIRSEEGHLLGVLSVVDVRTRSWSDADRATLEDLAALAGLELARFRQSSERLHEPAPAALAEADAARAGERFRILVEQAITGVYIIQDGRFVYANPRLADVTGYAPDELLHLPSIAAVVHPEDRALVADNIRRRLAGESVEMRYNFRGLRKDGGVVHVEVHGTTIEYEGRPAVLGTLVDVTDRRRMEDELIRAKERAEEMHRLKSSFLANMSHEIRTPLASIIGFSEILSDEITGEGREFVELINSSGKRLLETLNSVLDLAQLESGGISLGLEPVDLGEEIHNVIGMFTPQAAAKGLWLKVEGLEQAPSVVADRPALGRVLCNLLANAIKFTESGGVALAVRREHHRVAIDVTDTGIGIKPAFLPYVFEEFRQESSGTARTFEGCGLGLTISRKLIELMGGEISVQSSRGVGTTFSMWLHAAPPPEAACDANAAPPPEPAARKAVLVVEDTPEAQTLLRHILAAHFDVDVAGSAEEALSNARARVYAAFVVDINLGSDMDGIDLLRALRALPGGASARAVACTAYAMPGDEQAFRSSGFDAYLSKPFRRQELLRVLGDV